MKTSRKFSKILFAILIHSNLLMQPKLNAGAEVITKDLMMLFLPTLSDCQNVLLKISKAVGVPTALALIVSIFKKTRSSIPSSNIPVAPDAPPSDLITKLPDFEKTAELIAQWVSLKAQKGMEVSKDFLNNNKWKIKILTTLVGIYLLPKLLNSLKKKAEKLTKDKIQNVDGKVINYIIIDKDGKGRLLNANANLSENLEQI